MPKADLRSDHPGLYAPPKGTPKGAAWLVDVPPLNYIMLDGAGHPETSEQFQHAMGVLYGMSYTIKMSMKKDDPAVDWVVAPLEGLWWWPGAETFGLSGEGELQWTVMIRQPDFVTPEVFERYRAVLKARKDPPGLDEARLETLNEGLCAQVLHLGPYSEEAPTIERLHQFIAGEGYVHAGKHHEIYLSDPRRCAPETIRTILRQPVRRPV